VTEPTLQRAEPPAASVGRRDESTPEPGEIDRVSSDGSGAPASRLLRRLAIVSVVAAVVPVIVAAIRAIVRGWVPIGDDAFFKVRALDVFGRHIPLLGTWSSGSVTAHINLNHPGPLLFDALAAPVGVLGGPVGVPVGVALINVAAIIGIAVFAHRRGGPLLVTLAMAATAALCWAMGSELLFEPWQPHSLLVPFLFFLVLIWSMTAGDTAAIPFAVGVGSFILQTHLSYAVLVPVLTAWGVVGLLLALRSERRRDDSTYPALRRRARRASAVAGVVLVVAWAQPVIEQFTSSGPGNVTRLVNSGSDPRLQTVGFRTGAILVASVTSLPPFWFRPSVDHTFFVAKRWSPPSIGLAIFSLVVLVGVLAWGAWDARRRRDRAAGRAIVTAAVALPAALVTAAQSPVTVFGIYTPHEWRWLWPLSAFLFLAVAVCVARRVTFRHRPRTAWLVGGFTLVAVVLAALNLPTANLGDGPNSQEWAVGPAKQLADHMGALNRAGPLLIDDLFLRSFADPYGASVLAELQRRDVSFVAKDAGLVRQLGPDRQYTGRNARAALLLRTGESTLSDPPNARRVATAEGLSTADQRRLAALTRQLRDHIASHGLPLSPVGQSVLEHGHLPSLSQFLADPSHDPTPLFTSRELVGMINLHFLALDRTWGPRFAEYARLQRDWDRETVALFVRSIDGRAGGAGTR
jgi:hypothetical protein